MKLLFDENLSPRLPRILADLYPNSSHVQECGLGSADDSAIWQYAKENGFTIVSKDSDFQDRSVLHGYPPKFVWVRAENCSTTEIEKLLRAAAATIEQFVEQDEESYWYLGRAINRGAAGNKKGALLAHPLCCSSLCNSVSSVVKGL